MNKIILKLKPTHLKAVIDDFYNAQHLPALNRQEKVVNSIITELMIKLERRLITKRQEEHKDFKISLKYYEAFALAEICKYQGNVCAGEFEANTYRLIIAQLDKQL